MRPAQRAKTAQPAGPGNREQAVRAGEQTYQERREWPESVVATVRHGWYDQQLAWAAGRAPVQASECVEWLMCERAGCDVDTQIAVLE